MQKNGLRYSFEKTHKGDYQVRIKGQFIMYVGTKDSKLVDDLLLEEGFTSRQEVLDATIEESMRYLV